MTRGLYAAAGGMLVGLLQHEVVANNLANGSTPGYKADRVGVASFQRVFDGTIAGDGGAAVFHGSPTVGPNVIDGRAGSYTQTGNPLDLAVQGDGWFTVGTAGGERYTRAGRLTVAADGTLTTSDGLPILGEEGAIQVPDGAEVKVNRYGDVTADGQVLDRLRLVRFTDPATVVKVGQGLVTGGSPAPAQFSVVRQGVIEESNADVTRQMVDMLAAMRAYEMNQRVVRAQDETLEQAIAVAR